jgi:hypothetical protein
MEARELPSGPPLDQVGATVAATDLVVGGIVAGRDAVVGRSVVGGSVVGGRSVVGGSVVGGSVVDAVVVTLADVPEGVCSVEVGAVRGEPAPQAEIARAITTVNGSRT